MYRNKKDDCAKQEIWFEKYSQRFQRLYVYTILNI